VIERGEIAWLHVAGRVLLCLFVDEERYGVELG